MRQTVETAGVGEAFASPTSGDSLQELTRELGRLVGRERTRAFIERTVDAADVDLPPGAGVAARPGRGRARAATIPRRSRKAARSTRHARRSSLAGLAERGLVRDAELTGSGHATAARLIGARRDCLHSLIADWQPDDDQRVNDAVVRIARELARDVPALHTPG